MAAASEVGRYRATTRGEDFAAISTTTTTATSSTTPFTLLEAIQIWSEKQQQHEQEQEQQQRQQQRKKQKLANDNEHYNKNNHSNTRQRGQLLLNKKESIVVDIVGVVVDVCVSTVSSNVFTMKRRPRSMIWITDESISTPSTTTTKSSTGQQLSKVVVSLSDGGSVAQERQLVKGDVVRFNRVSLWNNASTTTNNENIVVYEFRCNQPWLEAGPSWFRFGHIEIEKMNDDNNNDDKSKKRTLTPKTMITSEIEQRIPSNMQTNRLFLERLCDWYSSSSLDGNNSNQRKRTAAATAQQPLQQLPPLACQFRSISQLQSYGAGIRANVQVTVLDLTVSVQNSTVSSSSRTTTTAQQSATVVSSFVALLQDATTVRRPHHDSDDDHHDDESPSSMDDYNNNHCDDDHTILFHDDTGRFIRLFQQATAEVDARQHLPQQQPRPVLLISNVLTAWNSSRKTQPLAWRKNNNKSARSRNRPVFHSNDHNDGSVLILVPTAHTTVAIRNKKSTTQLPSPPTTKRSFDKNNTNKGDYQEQEDDNDDDGYDYDNDGSKDLTMGDDIPSFFNSAMTPAAASAAVAKQKDSIEPSSTTTKTTKKLEQAIPIVVVHAVVKKILWRRRNNTVSGSKQQQRKKQQQPGYLEHYGRSPAGAASSLSAAVATVRTGAMGGGSTDTGMYDPATAVGAIEAADRNNSNNKHDAAEVDDSIIKDSNCEENRTGEDDYDDDDDDTTGSAPETQQTCNITRQRQLPPPDNMQRLASGCTTNATSNNNLVGPSILPPYLASSSSRHGPRPFPPSTPDNCQQMTATDDASRSTMTIPTTTPTVTSEAADTSFALQFDKWNRTTTTEELLDELYGNNSSSVYDYYSARNDDNKSDEMSGTDTNKCGAQPDHERMSSFDAAAADLCFILEEEEEADQRQMQDQKREPEQVTSATLAPTETTMIKATTETNNSSSRCAATMHGTDKNNNYSIYVNHNKIVLYRAATIAADQFFETYFDCHHSELVADPVLRKLMAQVLNGWIQEQVPCCWTLMRTSGYQQQLQQQEQQQGTKKRRRLVCTGAVNHNPVANDNDDSHDKASHEFMIQGKNPEEGTSGISYSCWYQISHITLPELL